MPSLKLNRRGSPIKHLSTSEKLKGNTHFLGKHHTEESKMKISRALIGHRHTPEELKKMSENRKGKRVGPEHRNWKGGKTITKDGYVLVKRPDHPNAKPSGYILEHRVIMEGKIGRLLKSDEFIHHINGIKDDNRPENLEIVRMAHLGNVICPYCNKKFKIR